ncbi:uncharacterized protein LOC131619688 [Vicia villosa]|uniref:uncharacterized protein LOC131619688 n=1 Tax=Vicia villosa TaxID=3911 RepID=UPI00273B3142|nr:uncharacterized protein LOC131619688 [Vicia villosa]
MAQSFWRQDEVDFSASNSEGMSRGLIILWNARIMEVLLSFRGPDFLGIKVIWKDRMYYVCNVYSACVLSAKRTLWAKLLDLQACYCDGEWLIGGDFNAVKNRGERLGRSVGGNQTEWGEFSSFIDNSGLIDVPCKGKRFSWFSGDGKHKSRIDRFLVSNNIISRWGVVGQLVGLRDISDHCPEWLVVDNKDWGPKPFKFNNEWFQHKELMPFLEREWKELIVNGHGDYVLKEKLRILKRKILWWSANIFGKIDLDMEEGVREINSIDDLDPDIVVEEDVRGNANRKFWLNLKIKENMIKQKARVRWINDGDVNSKYFHSLMKKRLEKELHRSYLY